MRLSWWLVGLSALLASAPPVGAADKPRRNVVLLIADDLGMQVGCYGDRGARTPNIDALAKRGVRFSHGFAAVSSCSPSRSVLYTGLHTHTSGQYGLAHGEHNFHTRAGVRSLPSYLRVAGYRTGIIGKTHIVPRSVYDFDEEIRATGRNGAQMARQARTFIDGCRETEFCLVMGYTDPHRAGKGKSFANEKKHPGIKERVFDPKDVTVPPFLPDRPDVRADLAEYYQSVHRLDQGVGHLLEVLKTTGRDRDTLVIFLSDNGIPFPGAKTTLYDSGIHLPLIVAQPGQKKPGLVNRALASWVDILPTILDWAGVKPPARLPGRSLLPILEEENPQGWDEVYASHQFHEVTMYYPMRAVRTRKYKYIRNLAHKLDYPFASDLYHSLTWQGILKRGDAKMGLRSTEAFLRRPLEELYDVEKDPTETRNLAGEAAHAKTLEALRQKVRAMQQKTGDPWMVKYQYE
jgi:N-sulfoglucosamine sulfohydrolase